MHDQQAGSKQDVPMDADSSVSGAVKLDCPPADEAKHSQGSMFAPEKRYKRETHRAAFVADKKVEKGHA